MDQFDDHNLKSGNAKPMPLAFRHSKVAQRSRIHEPLHASKTANEATAGRQIALTKTPNEATASTANRHKYGGTKPNFLLFNGQSKVRCPKSCRSIWYDVTVTEAAEPITELPDEDSETTQFRWRIAKNLTRRIDQYLVDRVGYLSRAEVQRVIKDGLVKVNGKPVKASYHPRDNDEVEMIAPPEPVSELTPEDIPLDIIYEDEHFLALNKQKDLIVHPARGRWSGTLVNGLVFYGKKWSGVGGNWRPGILHRLDRNTTGIMLVAKSDEAHWRIARQFERRTIQKTYLALVHGKPKLAGDIIDMPIGKDRFIREKQAVRKIENGGRIATTIYETLETLTDAAGQTVSLMKLTPKTGRTHQLRVHMSHIGYPIVGDTMYGGRVFTEGDLIFDRQALHAYEITFVHPATLQTMTLSAPLPADIRDLLGKVGSNRALQPIGRTID